MELERVKIGEAVVSEYRVLLRISGEICLPKDYPKIRAFCEKRIENTVQYAKEVVGARLCEEYASLTDTRAKARFSVTRCTLFCEPLYADETCALFRLEAVWSGEVIGRFEYASAWDLRDESLLLPREVKKHENLRAYASIFGEKSEKKIVKKLAN